MAEDPAERGANREADTEGGAEHAHAFSPLFARRHVADVRLRGGDISAGEPVNDARDVNEDQPERRAGPAAFGGEAEQHEAGDAADLRNDEHRPPAKAVAD